MAVSIDTQISAIGTANAGNGNAISATLTVANNTNRGLVALIGNDDTLTVNTVAYTTGSGGAWAKLGGPISNGQREYEIWTSIGPSTGSVTVKATYSGAGVLDEMVQLYSLFNTDQTTLADGFASNNTGTSSLNVTISSGGMGLCAGAFASNPDPIINGTQDLTDTVNDFWRAAHATDGVFAWTAGGRVLVGCNVRVVADTVGNIAWVKG
jgi:hypothetical protein